MAGRKLVYTRIRCVNRNTKQFFDRDFRIDLQSLPEAEQEQIEKMTKETISSDEFVRIRPLLKEGSWAEDFQSFDSMDGISVSDYFEDEEGNPLDMIGLAKITSGEEYPILLHDVRSVLRLGPTEICRKELWTTESANALAHFFQLVEIIGNGDWLKARLSMGGSWKIHSFQCPDLGQVYSILLPFRQLYSSDNAFNHACKVYLRHVTDDRKRWWVEATKKNFNAFLDSVPPMRPIEKYTAKQLLDLVMYGASLVHYGEVKPETRSNFKEAVSRHSRERVIYTFLYCCQHLYMMANHVYHVLRQDFEHWISTEGCLPPDLVFLNGLFTSHPLPTTDVAANWEEQQ